MIALISIQNALRLKKCSWQIARKVAKEEYADISILKE